MKNIPFNKPHLTGKEMHYLYEAVHNGKISGNGRFTQKCQNFFEYVYTIEKCLLTSSCTDALEMAALLLDIKPGDEIILPSYTFVSTANPFVMRGATIKFADCQENHPNVDVNHIASLITDKTKAIIPVHYGGVACNMEAIMKLASENDLYVVEDAAQAIDSYFIYKDGHRDPLGSIGHLAAFSFHESKNIISGEGGMLAINDSRFHKRSEIIWEKGTNRAAFFRGEEEKYEWVDVGSSFLPSEIVAAFLWAQLENLNSIQERRKQHWNYYFDNLKEWCVNNNVFIPQKPDYATYNYHIFSLVFENGATQKKFIRYMVENGIQAVFHYLSLHRSPYFSKYYNGDVLTNCDRFASCLVRLPLYFEIRTVELDYIIEKIMAFEF